MKTRISVSMWTSAFAAALGLSGCGGTADDDAGSGGAGGTAGAGSGGTSGSAGTSGSTAKSPYPCENPTPLLDAAGKPTGTMRCEMGGAHRVSASECASLLPRPETCTGPTPDGTCAVDADCTDRAHGSCVSGFGACECSYGCRTDADCGTGFVCICGSPVGSCQRATCTSDADCGGTLECRSFQDPQAGLCGAQAFECQHPGDECQQDADCAGGGAFCLSDAEGVHRCTTDFPCGVPGRPFLVSGRATVAPVVARADWSTHPTRCDDDALARLSSESRSRLAAHWTRAAQMEHASIAAFARFVLELLALGAPSDLVEDAQRAMADETAHARACFAMAGRYDGRDLGPGPLALDDCFADAAPESVLRRAVREGCFGETIAAMEAAESLAHATDPAARRLLGLIVEDESRHAAVAFRFVRWAMREDRALIAVVRDELRRAQRPRRVEGPVQDDPPNHEALAHGMLPTSHSLEIAERAVRDVACVLISRLVTEAVENRARTSTREADAA